MSFYRLFTSLALIVLLVPAGTAWGGAGITGFRATDLLAERECSLEHVCKDHANQGCKVELKQDSSGNNTCISNEPSDCPSGDPCVVKYVSVPDIDPDTIPGTLTIIADDQPVIQSGCAARTILLKVDKQTDGLANTALVEDAFPRPNGTLLEPRLIQTSGTDSDKFRYRRTDSDFTEELKELALMNLVVFDETKLAGSVPVVADVGKRIIYGNHVNDPLGSVLSFRVGIRFAFPIPKKDLTFTPQQDDMPCLLADLNCDHNVDTVDLNILLANLNKSVSQSTCGTTSCGATCDLDSDGKITALDSRKLTLLCTRPRCATK